METLVVELNKLGVTIVHSDRYARVERTTGTPPRVACETQSGRRLDSDVLLYCVGRDGNTNDIGLGTLGIRPGKYGLLEVNEHYQTVHPHIYAVGDVIGYPALASTSMEQGRQAMRHALGIPGPKGRTEILPFAVYSVPEVAYIGETEEALVAKGIDYVAGRGSYDKNPRGQILGEYGGMVKLLFERPSLKLVGAHVVGSAASEIIHVGQAFLRAGTTATDIAETLYNYPTLSDMYRHAAVKALGRGPQAGMNAIGHHDELGIREAGRQGPNGLEEVLDGREVVESLDNPVEVEGHVLVDHDVPEARQALQLPHEVGVEPGVPRQAADRLRVVLEAVPAPGGKVSRQVDHQLADRQQGEEDVVVQREIALERLPPGDAGADLAQVVQVPPELGEPLDQVRHRARASSLRRRVRRRNGSRSAARSIASRTKA